jgi:hypothetical protein
VARPIDVYIETGSKRAFASAADWPGWSRGARTEEDALRSLADYGTRYARVLRRRVPGFAPPAGPSSLRVVDRSKGNATTDFGAPGVPSRAEDAPMKPTEADRRLAVLTACWAALDRAAAAAEGVTLTKGPRGGGRDLDKIVRHVAEAEGGYLSRIGGKLRLSEDEELASQVRAARAAVLDTLGARIRGEPPPENPRRTAPLWPPRYFIRRVAWHALDHAWEIEDRSSD